MGQFTPVARYSLSVDGIPPIKASAALAAMYIFTRVIPQRNKKRRQTLLLEALETVIRTGLTFDLDDFIHIFVTDAYEGEAEVICTSRRREQVYALACQTKNRSACLAYEKFFPPIFGRLCLGEWRVG